MMHISLAGLLLLLALADPAPAQQRTEVDRVETLVAAGEYADARALLERWWQRVSGGEHAEAAIRARALLLRARLAVEPRSAEQDYLAVVLGHPTTPQAAEALLALGQGLLATGDIARAVAYLERLVADYPASPQRGPGLVWLARARRANGNDSGACAATRRGLMDPAADSDLAPLLRIEEAASCRATAMAPAVPERFTIQSGAFREHRGAAALAASLRKAGFEPRLVFLPGSPPLVRVRVGRFPAAAAAEEHARRLRAAGFTVLVVDDATRERASP